MKNPPVLIAVLGFFAALAGFGWLFFGLRVLGFDWFGALGDLPAFEHVGLWGWLAVISGIVWLLVALGLWALQPWARLFAQIIAGLALFEAVLAFFQFPGTGVGFAMAIMPILILWYLSTTEVKVAFGLVEPAVPMAAAAAAAAAPAPAPAPAVAAPVAFAAAATAPTTTMAPAAAAPVAPMAAMAPAATGAAPAAMDTPPVARVNVEDVEGIGPAYADKLAAAGVKTTDDLLSAGATASGRDRLAETTGISGKLVLAWVNKVDLMRVPGVGAQYSDLLEVAGVDSPAELANRNPANLAVTVQEVIAARPGIVRRAPSEAEIAAWVEAAGKLDKVVEH